MCSTYLSTSYGSGASAIPLPGRPVGPLKAYIRRNQVESDHTYSAYPGASVRDVRSGLALRCEVDNFAKNASELSPEIFAVEFNPLLVSVQNKLGTFGPIPE